MRRLLALCAVLAACELQPAPKKQPGAPSPSPAAVAASPAPSLAPSEVGSGSGSAGKPAVTQACIDAGAHVAEVFIASAADPAQKSVYEQERTKMVRATAEACTNQQWPAEALGCYNASKTPAEIKACEQRFPPPPSGRAAQPPVVRAPPAEAQQLGKPPAADPGALRREPVPARPKGEP